MAEVERLSALDRVPGGTGHLTSPALRAGQRGGRH
jgi:hypothetical protein